MTAQLLLHTETIPSVSCEPLAWDTTFWGIPIARVYDQTLTVASSMAIDQWAQEHRIECLYFLSQIDDPSTLSIAKAQGFQITDIRTTLILSRTMQSASCRPRRGNDAVIVRPACPSDVPLLREITHDCFHDTRFYNDVNFPRERCRALYETWITRSCAGYADLVLVAEIAGIVRGFISCHFAPTTRVGTIGLVGVSAQARKQGIGHTLIRHALVWFAARDTCEVSVVTQGRNIAAQHLYMRSGFHVSAEDVWFHKWYAHT